MTQILRFHAFVPVPKPGVSWTGWLLRASAVFAAVLSAAAANGQAGAAATSQASASQSAAERSTNDEGISRIGREFDLDAYVTALKPPTVEELVASLGEISTIDETLDAVRRPERVPVPTSLPADIATDVGALDDRLRQLRNSIADERVESNQDRDLDEAIGVAERIVARRRAAGQSDECPEVRDAQRAQVWIQDFKRLPAPLRQALSASDAAQAEAAQLVGAGRYADAIDRVTVRVALVAHLREKFGTADDPLISTYILLGAAYGQSGRLDRSACLFRAAASRALENLGRTHPTTVRAIANLGNTLSRREDFVHAEMLARWALVQACRNHGAQHASVVPILRNWATALDSLGRLRESEEAARVLVERCKRQLPQMGWDYGNSYMRLGIALLHSARPAEAEQAFRQCLDIWQGALAENDPWIGIALGNLSLALDNQGRPAESELCARRGIEIVERHPFYAGDFLMMKSNLAGQLEARGDLAGAEALFRETIAAGTTGGRDAIYTETARMNLALVLANRGKPEEALPLIRAVVESRRARGPTHEASLAESLLILGVVQRERGDEDASAAAQAECLELRRKLLSPRHPDLVGPLNNVAVCAMARGNLRDAEQLASEAVAICRADPEASPSRFYRLALGTLADVKVRQGQLAVAEPLLREAMELAERERPAIAGGELDRAAFGKKLRIGERAHSYASLLISLGRAREVLEVLERGRGRAALDLLERSGRDLFAEAGSRGDASLTERVTQAQEAERQARSELVSAETLLAGRRKERAAWESLDEASDDVRRARYATLDEQIAMLDADVAQKRQTLSSAESRTRAELCGLFPAAQPRSTTKILAELDADEAIISISWAEVGVLVAVAAEGDSAAEAIAGDQIVTRKLAELAERVRGSITEPTRVFDQRAADELLRTMFPDSIVGRLTRARRLVIVPDGPFASIPLDALVAASPHSPLANKAIAYAPSATVYLDRKGKQLASPAAQSQPTATAVVLGAPIFDREPSPPDDSTQETIVAAVAPMRSTRAVLDAATRGAGELAAQATAIDQVRLFGAPLRALPGFEREPRAVAACFSRSQFPTTLLTGEDATIPKLLEVVRARQPRYLHLATHGLMGSSERPLDAALALTQPTTPTLDDLGFLRLEDLIARWGATLEGCELVVLSACDTQRGAQVGDTRMSLPLGFFFAGARSVVASLWKVDDAATQLLMTRMYENLLGAYGQPRTVRNRMYGGREPMTKLDALDEAKTWLRSLTETEKDAALAQFANGTALAADATSAANRGPGQPQPAKSPGPESARPYAHPFYWAAFVLVGAAE